MAENEVQGLRSYFVPTGLFLEAKRGHARVVIGPKGTGKTAIFYAPLDSFSRSQFYLVLDIMPEGHQFQTLREAVLQKLSPGLQESVMTAFWYYLLLCELAQRI
jgi:ABC-type transporter Mla maintaining outer membrane lipid asymmetry ATPase subunit MlaF